MNLCIYNLTHKTSTSKGKTKYFFIEMIDVGQYKFLLKNSGLTETTDGSSSLYHLRYRLTTYLPSLLCLFPLCLPLLLS